MASSSLRRVRTRFAVELHPSKAESVLEGVYEQLNAQLLRYSSDVDGVIMAYGDVRVLTKRPLIHPYFPYFHVDVATDVLLFKPEPGAVLEGQVNQVGHDYIALLVLGVFNASIPAEHIRTEFRYNEGSSTWQSSTSGKHAITAGSEVEFRVVSVADNAGFFSITGSLQEPGTGLASYVQKQRRKQAGGGGDKPAAAAAVAAAGKPSAKQKKKDKAKSEAGEAGQAQAAASVAAAAATTAAAAVEEGRQGKEKKRKKHREGGGQGEHLQGIANGALVATSAAARSSNGPAAAEDSAGHKKSKKKEKRKEQEDAAAAVASPTGALGVHTTAAAAKPAKQPADLPPRENGVHKEGTKRKHPDSAPVSEEVRAASSKKKKKDKH